MDSPQEPESLSNEKLVTHYRHLMQMQDLVAELSSNLIHCPPEEVSAVIGQSIAKLGAFAKVDRVYVFEFAPGDIINNTHEWCADDIEPQIDFLQNLPISLLDFWIDALFSGQAIYVADVMALPDERAFEREFLARQGIKSMLVIPMVHEGHLIGFIGFDAVREHRAFVSGEARLLKWVADLVYAALLRFKGAQQITRAEAELGLQEERFRIIADTVSDVLWDHDFDKRAWWMSPGWRDKLGMVAQAEVADHESWFARVHPDDQAKLQASFREVLRSRSPTWEVDYRVVGDDKQSIDILVKATVFRHADGRVSRMLGNARNITQERRNQEGYTRARALEAVGQLTGGIAHDFNNLLMIIMGNAEMLELSDLAPDDAERVAIIAKATDSAATLTRQLLTFARQSTLNTTRVDLKALLTDTVGLLRSGLPDTITLQQRIPADVWDANADANGLQQAVVNLAMNAEDAMPDGGDIVLTCRNLELDAETGAATADLPPGRYVAIALRDSGEGMAPDVLSRAFEPFFTTKDVGKGTGLGLSTVHGFAKQSGGGATIKSEPGRGTTVTLYLPVYRGSVAGDQETRPETGAQPRPARPKRLLVVEDQPQVRAYVEKMLTRLGYDVTGAADAASALERIARGEQFDLLFTDVMMPGGMNGEDLSVEVRKHAPDIRIVFTSGYPATTFEHLRIDPQDGIFFLDKPYKVAKLRATLAQVLGE
ncbi:MAG: ATP-binding protein [Porphyrobacter sp.]|nr:ATP-binding protein [Porphyrobacter sp.]